MDIVNISYINYNIFKNIREDMGYEKVFIWFIYNLLFDSIIRN